MGVDKWIAGEIMVKGITIELHHVGLTTFMVAMTMTAFLFQRIWLASVVLCAPSAVGRDLLMTVETEVGLGVTRK
jgi:hypothetical protein